MPRGSCPSNSKRGAKNFGSPILCAARSIGPWSIRTVLCRKGPAGPPECPELEAAVIESLRPRKANDVDLVGALRGHARQVEICVMAEDAVPATERIYGRIEMDLEVAPTGQVRVQALAPARVARATLGRCLMRAMQAMNVGPFDGAPIRLRIPLDL